MRKTLLLFDIDGTLTTSARVFRRRFAAAVNEAFKTRINNEPTTSGKTDTGVLLEYSQIAGIKRTVAKQHLPQLYSISTKYVEKKIRGVRIHVKIGVRPLLNKLEGEGYVLGLVTGNLKQIARLKLGDAGLYKFFKLGGFGEISDKRSKLIRAAIKQAQDKFKIDRNRVFYFGDAPLDILAGKEAKVITVGVATGHYPLAVLKRYKPDYLLKDFSDTERILGIVTRGK